MIRRTPIETRVNHERWLVSYADFITLLFAFFVVMYSVSYVNESKYQELTEILQETFGPKDGDAKEKDASESVAQGALQDIRNDLVFALQPLLEDGQIDVKMNRDWLEIEFQSENFFDSGSAQLTPEATQVFTVLAESLQPYSNKLTVSGHTDNVPIRTKKFKDNWSLSAARAVSVVNVMAEHGLPPEKLSAVGYGEFQPVADNETEEGRRKNRRVVVSVLRYAGAPQPGASDIENTQSSGKTMNTTAQMDTSKNTAASPAKISPSETNSRSTSAKTPAPSPTTVAPVTLKGGGLLFSSDPDLPRIPPSSP